MEAILKKVRAKRYSFICHVTNETTIFSMYGISIAAIREHHNEINWKKIIQAKAHIVTRPISRLQSWKKEIILQKDGVQKEV